MVPRSDSQPAQKALFQVQEAAKILAAEVDRLRALIDEFATFCDDSGWPHVAAELRRRMEKEARA